MPEIVDVCIAVNETKLGRSRSTYRQLEILLGFSNRTYSLDTH